MPRRALALPMAFADDCVLDMVEYPDIATARSDAPTVMFLSVK